jgi:pSer/pThr/pTyr-binding forkhead associated (FHA) protein
MLIHVILTATAGEPKSRDFVLEGARQVLIGRSSNCDLQVDDPTVSRRHCSIDTDGEAVWVRDIGSMNGTYINGEKIGQPQFVLHDGDVLRLGNHEFRITLEVVDPPEGEDTRPVMMDLCGECIRPHQTQ